jgi:signal transduction histidine kinase
VTVEIGELPPCEGDTSLLEQVLINLLSNAFKFSRERADAQVTVSSIERRAPDPPHALERIYFVRDNGTGFDMKHAEHLFGVFRRLHSQAQFEGTGVGLSIVQRIVTRHGGRVWAESPPSRVRLSISLCPRHREPHAGTSLQRFARA